MVFVPESLSTVSEITGLEGTYYIHSKCSSSRSTCKR